MSDHDPWVYISSRGTRLPPSPPAWKFTAMLLTGRRLHEPWLWAIFGQWLGLRYDHCIPLLLCSWEYYTIATLCYYMLLYVTMLLYATINATIIDQSWLSWYRNLTLPDGSSCNVLAKKNLPVDSSALPKRSFFVALPVASQMQDLKSTLPHLLISPTTAVWIPIFGPASNDHIVVLVGKWWLMMVMVHGG